MRPSIAPPLCCSPHRYSRADALTVVVLKLGAPSTPSTRWDAGMLGWRESVILDGINGMLLVMSCDGCHAAAESRAGRVAVQHERYTYGHTAIGQRPCLKHDHTAYSDT